VTSLADAVAGGLLGWEGLSEGLDEAALRSQLDAHFTREPVPRPRAARGYIVLHGERATPAEQVDAWIPLGAEAAATVEFKPPAGLDDAALLADLGEPELVLDSNHFEVGAVVRDEVHAARGITLAVAEPFESGPRRVVYVQLYPPTTPQAYVTDVGQSGEELRPYPRSD
jgi:hypothetical protein